MRIELKVYDSFGIQLCYISDPEKYVTQPYDLPNITIQHHVIQVYSLSLLSSCSTSLLQYLSLNDTSTCSTLAGDT
jgi:hypothetical protein